MKDDWRSNVGSVIFWRGTDGLWYFKVIAANRADELVRSTDGYVNKGDAVSALAALKQVLNSGHVTVSDGTPIDL